MQDLNCGGCSPERVRVMDGWLTRAELSAEIGVAVSTLEKWASERRGPVSIRVGARVYYSREAVRRWLVELEHRGWGVSRPRAGN